jgi:hypothetical protein
LVESLDEQTAHIKLVFLGRRSKSAGFLSDESRHKELGRHLEEVVRQIKQPLFTITQAFTEPKNSMVAFDGGAVTRKV